MDVVNKAKRDTFGVIISFGTFFLACFSIINFFYGNITPAIIDGFLALCGLILIVRWSLKKSINFSKSIVLLLIYIHFLLLACRGGIGNAEILWLYTYPVVCFLMEDFKKSIFWISVFLASLFILFSLHFLSVIKLPYSNGFILIFLSSLFAVSGFMFLTETIKIKAENHIRKKNEDMAKELNLAKKIQQNYMCSSYESFKDIEANVYFRPMMDVGGDIFDIVRIKNGYYRVFIADATGHGIQAALLTMIIKTEYDRIKFLGIQPNMLLEILNNAFIEAKKGLTIFFSCAIADININENTLLYSAAGHPPQFLITDHEVEELTTTDYMLGVSENKTSSYRLLTFPFRKDFKLTLFTDGVSEIRTKKTKKIVLDEIKALLEENKNSNTVSIIKNIKDKLNLWWQNEAPGDDITLICLEHK